jgi:hypothetical protein
MGAVCHNVIRPNIISMGQPKTNTRTVIEPEMSFPGGWHNQPTDDPVGGHVLSMLSKSNLWCQELFQGTIYMKY